MSWASVLRGAAAVLALTVAGPARPAENIVNIFGWADYFDPRILEDFTSETGIRVTYDKYASTEALEAALTGDNDYDVAVVPGRALQAMIAAGALRKLDKTRLANLSGLGPEAMTRLASFDPGGQYGAPYLWFTTGIAFDVDKAKATGASFDPASWDTLFRPDRLAAFADCGVFVVDSPEELFAIALRYLKLNPGSKNLVDLRRAAELLGTMRRYVKKFSSAGLAGALANGDFCLAVGSSVDSLQGRARAREADNGVDIDYAVPKEGAPMSIDSLVVPKNAPHGDAALAFINFALRPEVAARDTNATRLANAVPASSPWIAKDILENRSIYLDPGATAALFAVPRTDPATQKFIAREWARIKTGKYPGP